MDKISKAMVATLVLALGVLDGCNRSTPGSSASQSGSEATPQSSPLTDAEIKYGVSPTHSSEVTYQDDVIVMEHGAEAIRSLSSNGLTYTLDANAPGAKDIRQDKILFATGRVVGRVLEVKRNGNDVAVTLGPIELTDVFKEAHISYHGTLDPDQMIVYQAPPEYPGTFIDQDAADPNAADPPSAMRQPGKTSIRIGSFSPSGESISLPMGRYGVRNPVWADSDREHFRHDAASLVSALQGRRDGYDCDNTTAAVAIPKNGLQDKSGCGGSGGNTIADILIDSAHFLPDVSQGLGVTASNTKGGMTFTTSVKLRLARPDFTFNLDITGGRVKTAEVELNVSGGLKVSFKGATGGEFKNFNKITELPLDISFPIPVGAGFAATFHQAILIQTMFTAKQAMIDVAGDYTLSGSVKAGIVNGKPGGTSDVSLAANQNLGDSLSGVSLGINGLVLGYSAKIIAGIGAYSFVVGPYASLNTTVGATRGSDQQGLLMGGVTCRSAEFHMWLDYGVGVAVPNFVVKVLNGILSVFSSKAAISSSYSTKLGKIIIKDIMEYIPAGCAPKAS